MRLNVDCTDLKKGLDRAISVQNLLPKVSAVAMLKGTTLPIVRCITILM